RRPHVHGFSVANAVVFVAGVMNARRHDAGDGEGLTIQDDLAAYDLWIGGEAAAPDAVAQNGDITPAGQLVVRSELTAERGRNAENAEIAGGETKAGEVLGLSAAGELAVFPSDGGDTPECVIARANIANVQGIQRELGIGGVGEENPHDAIGLRVG